MEGTILFKVTLPKCYRIIKASMDHTLKDLHKAIQYAFEFDCDHLYAFYMDCNIRSHENVYWGGDDESPFASETLIGQFAWKVGQKFVYLFDFGDEWIFNIQVMEINSEEEIGKFPQAIEFKGTPPPQYPPLDEDEEEDW